MNVKTFRSDASTDPASTNSFANVPVTGGSGHEKVDYLTAWDSGPISAQWKNSGANSIDFQILGGNDPAMADADKKVVDSGTISSGASSHVEIPLAYYMFYWFQQKATVAAAQGASRILGRFAAV